MQMDSADTASQIVFAGIRFTLAGLLVLVFTSIREKKVMFPDKEVLKYAIPVCLAQTVGQYFFFYIGVANTSGVKGGIITGLGNFIAILLSCLVFFLHIRQLCVTHDLLSYVISKPQVESKKIEKLILTVKSRLKKFLNREKTPLKKFLSWGILELIKEAKQSC